MENLKTLLLVDDHPLIRSGIKQSLLSKFSKLKIHEAETIAEANNILCNNQIDLVFLDINLPDGNGIEYLNKIKSKNSKQKVIILSMYNDEELIQAAIEAQVDGYLTKDCDEEEIQLAITSAFKGRRYLSRSVLEAVIKRVEKTDELRIILSQLSTTEKKILSLVAEMKSSKEIGEELFIHYRTVENHRTNICSKLGISGTNALLKFAIENKSHL